LKKREPAVSRLSLRWRATLAQCQVLGSPCVVISLY
jgi:hypothetical protein